LSLTFETTSGRIENTLPATNPGIAGHDELLPRHIEGIEGDAESRTQRRA
jgi:hypothetical protein